MKKKIIVASLVVCILGCLNGCALDARKTSETNPSEEKVAKSTAIIGWLDVSRIYQQPQDNELVHIKLHGLINNVGWNEQGNYTIETAFCEVGASDEIPGSGEMSHIFIGKVDQGRIQNGSVEPAEVFTREFDITLYEPLEVQKQAGKEFRLIVYLKQVVNLETNEKLTLQKLPTSFVFTASPLQPYQIQ